MSGGAIWKRRGGSLLTPRENPSDERRTMTQTPESILKDWIAAVNAGDVEGLLALYDERAVLIPTFSNRVLKSPERIRDYFEKLAGRDELSVSVHDKTLIVQPLRDTLATISGIYCWRFAVDEELLSFEARFSYILDLDLDRPIRHHHSSQIPRTL